MRIFVDIDSQRDFMNEDGSMYIPNAIFIRKNLKKLTDYAMLHKKYVLASKDWHAPDDPEFEEFPPHAVQNTEGAMKIAETYIPNHSVFPIHKVTQDILDIRLQASNAFCFEKQTFNVFSNHNFYPVLKQLNVKSAVVYGVATEFGVKEVVMGLLQVGIKVEVVKNAIQSIDWEVSGVVAKTEMLKAGATFVLTDNIIHNGH